MYDVTIVYFDETFRQCLDITKIVYPSDNGHETVTGEKILTHYYPLDKPLYLYAESAMCVIAPKDIKSIEISRK